MDFINEEGIIAGHCTKINSARTGGCMSEPCVIHYNGSFVYEGFKFVLGHKKGSSETHLYEVSTGSIAVSNEEVSGRRIESYYKKLLDKLALHKTTIGKVVASYCFNELDLPLWKKTVLILG